MRVPSEIIKISGLSNDFEKFKALFVLLNSNFKIIDNSIYAEGRRFDFNAEHGELINIENL